MRFAELNSLPLIILLIGVLAAVLLRAQKVRKSRLKAIADEGLLPLVAPSVMRIKPRRSLLLSLLIALLLGAAYLRPQWGFTWREVPRQGVDLAIAVDLSQSMLAQDVAPSRLERARRKLLDLLPMLQGDRLSLIGFAGTAFVEMPLSSDYGAFRTFLDALSPDLMPVQGTNIEAAVRTAVKTLEDGALVKEGVQTDRGRAVFVLTDGEDFEGDLAAVHDLCQEKNVKLFLLGIGSADGAPIPLPGGGYKRDSKGEMVVTRMRPEKLKELAEKTGGAYVLSVAGDQDLKILYEGGIRPLVRTGEGGSSRERDWNEYFQPFIFLGVLLLVLQAFLRARGVVFAILLLGLPEQARAGSPEEVGRDARQAFEQGDYESAREEFSRGKEEFEEDFRFHIGEGASFYRLEKFAEAKQAFLDASGKTENREERAFALYNAANAAVQLEQYEEAVKLYEQSLQLVRDREAKENLEYVKKLIKQNQQSQQNQQQQNQQQDDKKEEQKQSEQNNQDKKEEQQKSESEQQKPEEKSDDQKSEENRSEESKEENSDQKPEQQKQPQDQPSNDQKPSGGGDDEERQMREAEGVLQGVQESQNAHQKWRALQAQEEIRERDRPEKDW